MTTGEVIALIKAFGGGGGSSGGGVLVVHEDEETFALDKTWQEIVDSDLCILKYYGTKMIQYGASMPVGQGKFRVRFWDFSESAQVVYAADAPTGYPVFEENP